MREIEITVYKDDKRDPMAVTLEVIGCFKPSKMCLCGGSQ